MSAKLVYPMCKKAPPFTQASLNLEDCKRGTTGFSFVSVCWTEGVPVALLVVFLSIMAKRYPYNLPLLEPQPVQ